MELKELGYSEEIENYRKENGLDSFSIGRVISEHKERYIVKTNEGDFEGEIIGNLRFTATKRSDFPAVGDWVAISEYDDKVLIHSVLPRKTIIERTAIGKQGEKQIIASNIDYAFIIQSVDRDYSINRIERYITICSESDVEPIIIINKIDLIVESEVEKIISEISQRINQAQVFTISNKTGQGIEDIKQVINSGKTYCFLGSSGVGKSTLINNISGKELMKTNDISESTNRGKHVTTHRELIVLESGGILIDNPGMREIGISDSGEGLEKTFSSITELAEQCKFRDCTHTSESGCAVLDALESGEIDQSSYENYLKMMREKEHFESSVVEKRQKDKDFGKMVKNFKKIKNKRK